MQEKLSDKMIRYRAAHNLSIADASLSAGIASTTWMYVEREVQTPSRLTEAKIRQLIEVDAGVMFQKEEEEKDELLEALADLSDEEFAELEEALKKAARHNQEEKK